MGKKAFIVLAAVIGFLAGYATERWLNSKDDSDRLSPHSVDPLSKNISTNQPKTIDNLSDNRAEQSEWYDKDYSGNWNELLAIVLTLKSQDESLRHLFPRIRKQSISEQKALLKAALDHPEKDRLSLIIGWAFQGIVLDSFEEGIDAFSELSAEDQRQFAWLLANSLGMKDAEKAWKWIDSVESGETEVNILPDQLPSFRMMTLASMLSDPEKHNRALELAMSTSDVRVKESLTGQVVTAMMDHDIRQALANLEIYPELSETVTDNLIQTWAEDDTTTASNYLKDNPDLVTRKRLAEVAKNLIHKNDYREFNDLYESLNSDRMKMIMAYRAAAHQANSNIDESINWIRTIPDGMSRRQAAAAAIKEMGYTDNLNDHIHIIDSAFDGYEQERFELYRETLEVWQKKHPEQVANTIRTLPESDRNLREALEASLVTDGNG